MTSPLNTLQGPLVVIPAAMKLIVDPSKIDTNKWYYLNAFRSETLYSEGKVQAVMQRATKVHLRLVPWSSVRFFLRWVIKAVKGRDPALPLSISLEVDPDAVNAEAVDDRENEDLLFKLRVLMTALGHHCPIEQVFYKGPSFEVVAETLRLLGHVEYHLRCWGVPALPLRRGRARLAPLELQRGTNPRSPPNEYTASDVIFRSARQVGGGCMFWSNTRILVLWDRHEDRVNAWHEVLNRPLDDLPLPIVIDNGLRHECPVDRREPVPSNPQVAYVNLPKTSADVLGSWDDAGILKMFDKFKTLLVLVDDITQWFYAERWCCRVSWERILFVLAFFKANQHHPLLDSGLAPHLTTQVLELIGTAPVAPVNARLPELVNLSRFIESRFFRTEEAVEVDIVMEQVPLPAKRPLKRKLEF